MSENDMAKIARLVADPHADETTALRARVAKLEVHLADTCRVRDEWCDAYTKLRDEMPSQAVEAALRARVAKLEVALKEARADLSEYGEGYSAATIDHALRVISAALKDAPQ